jgi:hypothetical protein
MSTDWRVVSCQGKEAFASWQLAEQVRKGRGRRNDRTDQRQVYRCEFCHKFHLGTPGRPKQQRRK